MRAILRRSRILISDYMITDHWSVMCTWRSYLMILSVLTMRAILRRRKYWAVRLTSPAGYFPSIQLNIRIVPVRFVLTDFSCIWDKRWQCTQNKNKRVSESFFDSVVIHKLRTVSRFYNWKFMGLHCNENPIYVFLFLGIARPQSQFPHSCVCERFMCS